MDPMVLPLRLIVAGAGPLAALSIVLAGFAMILGRRQWCGKLILLAVLFVVVSLMGPAWLPPP